MPARARSCNTDPPPRRNIVKIHFSSAIIIPSNAERSLTFTVYEPRNISLDAIS